MNADPKSSFELEELFLSNLALIDRLVRSTCRPYGMSAADVDDFGSHTKVRIIEGGYAILRKFKGDAALSTYLGVVVKRLLNDYRVHILGKWRPSAEAKRLGPVALTIERLLTRDRLSHDEAFRVMQASKESPSRAEFDRIAARIPARQVRARMVPLDDLEQEPALDADHVENRTAAAERTATADAVTRALIAALSELADHERTLLRLHFVAEMSIAEIARSLKVPQKPLYGRLETICKRLRGRLVAAGIDKNRAAEIIGKADVLLDFGLRATGSWPMRPSMNSGSGRRREDGSDD